MCTGVDGGMNQTLHTSASGLSRGDHCSKRRGHGRLLHADGSDNSMSVTKKTIASHAITYTHSLRYYL